MPVVWKKTKYPGVRSYEHKTRKNGIQKDKYFAIRYQAKGKRTEEGLGWASEGWSAEKAALELAELKKAHTLGAGPSRLSDKRQQEQDRQTREQQEKARLDKENITFKLYFTETYFPIAKTSKRTQSYVKEEAHFKLWIESVLGDLPLKNIRPFHIEKIKKNMLDAGKAPRYIQYVLATIRQAWNMARRSGLVNDESPTRQVKIPKIDNRRLRFLNKNEAKLLLENLSIRDNTVYNMALLSLHTGMRAGEIFNLKRCHVDIDRRLISIIDPKGNLNRTAYMTEQVKAMFASLHKKSPDSFVFVDKEGKKFKEMSNTFRTAVKALGLNEGRTDHRQRVVFHTLRHTFASWHVESGTDLYTVKELMGHGSITMTERYSHLGQNTLQIAVKNLEKSINNTEGIQHKISEVENHS